jgi:hypothetical protein
MEKRHRERVRRQKRQDKEQRKAERKVEKDKRAIDGTKDSDLEGIVPGPQPGQIIDLS